MKDKLRLLAEQTGNPALGTFSLDELTEDNVLVYSRFDNNKIYLLDGEQPVEMARRDNHIYSLVSHEGVLYDGGFEGIYETFTGDKIVERFGYVQSLVSHNGELYDSDGGPSGRIYETLTGNKIAERDSLVRSLVSHDGKLYEGRGDGEIYETLTGDKIAAERNSNIWSLVSHKGMLYDCGGHSGRIYETLSGVEIAGRDDRVYSLRSHNGELYDCGEDGIYETFSKEKIADGCILSMASVPRSIVEEAGIL